MGHPARSSCSATAAAISPCAIGLELDRVKEGMGMRTQRDLMLVDDGVVKNSSQRRTAWSIRRLQRRIDAEGALSLSSRSWRGLPPQGCWPRQLAWAGAPAARSSWHRAASAPAAAARCCGRRRPILRFAAGEPTRGLPPAPTRTAGCAPAMAHAGCGSSAIIEKIRRRRAQRHRADLVTRKRGEGRGDQWHARCRANSR